jgi:hypothetical protein
MAIDPNPGVMAQQVRSLFTPSPVAAGASRIDKLGTATPQLDVFVPTDKGTKEVKDPTSVDLAAAMAKMTPKQLATLQAKVDRMAELKGQIELGKTVLPGVAARLVQTYRPAEDVEIKMEMKNQEARDINPVSVVQAVMAERAWQAINNGHVEGQNRVETLFHSANETATTWQGPNQSGDYGNLASQQIALDLARADFSATLLSYSRPSTGAGSVDLPQPSALATTYGTVPTSAQIQAVYNRMTPQQRVDLQAQADQIAAKMTLRSTVESWNLDSAGMAQQSVVDELSRQAGSVLTTGKSNSSAKESDFVTAAHKRDDAERVLQNIEFAAHSADTSSNLPLYTLREKFNATIMDYPMK